jgi:alkyl sulfatase BDS1-like metallo-beta-lactamase superfamily hydrolase
MTEKKDEKVGAVQLINISEQNLKIVNPRQDVYCARMPIAGNAWIDTGDGVVLIDTLLSKKAASKVLEKIHEDCGQIKYLIYTHGHMDHCGSASVYMGDNPEVIASSYLPNRLDKYKMLAPHRARIAAQQFNIPEIVGTGEDWVYPTKTFLGEMTFKLGNKTFELYTDRAETDDVLWVWVPELKLASIGDLMIRGFPNVGNPWKPTRFALDWAKTLEKIRDKKPETVLFGGANGDLHSDDAMTALNHNIEAIRSLHDQVVDCINKNIHISEMIHLVQLPEHLKESPYLNMGYSRNEFFVYNVYRWYHGYFDHNPANLLPRPQQEVQSEVFSLIGEPDIVIKRAKELLAKDQAQLGLQVLDVLLQAKPENVPARQLRVKLLEKLGADDTCLMSRNSWVYFIERDKEFLKSKGVN